jgi:predicted porin
MKKTLVAIAALAAFGAQAQSSVTITGVFDAGYRSVNAPLGGDTKGAFQNGTATSAIFFRGTEEINGDLSASFQYEINPDFVGGAGVTGAALEGTATTGADPQVRTSNGANGNNFVGVTSKSMGGVKFGRLNSPTLASWGVGSVYGTALGSGYGSNGNVFTRNSSSVANFLQSAPTRFNGAVEYTSPSIAGFTARVLYVPQVDNSEAGNVNNGTVATLPGANRVGVQDLGLAYSQGPLNAAVSQQTQKTGANSVNGLITTGTNSLAANSSYKLTTYAANYTIGAAKLYAAMWTEKQDVVAATNTPVFDASGKMFGVKYTIGQTDVSASYGKRNDKSSVDVGTGVANADKKVLGLGADYNVSKRTALWARYESRDANTNVTADTTAAGVTKTTAVGIRHAF